MVKSEQPPATPTPPPIDPSELKGRRFGRVLTKLKKVTREQVHEALALQKTRARRDRARRSANSSSSSGTSLSMT